MGDVKIEPGRTRSASYVTRAFGHLMDLDGVNEGTWIVGCLFLSSAPSKEEMQTLLSERILQMGRFKSVLKVNKWGGKFVEVDEMDWDYHLNTEFENETISEEGLLEFVGNMLEYKGGLDAGKPLWRFVLIPKMENGNACLVCCINHAIGDGVSTIGVLLKMLDDAPIDPTLPAKEQKGFVPSRRTKKPSIPLTSRVGNFFGGIAEGLFAPLGKHDPPNALKMKASMKASNVKRLAMGEQVSLDKVKEIKSKFAGATVNDVLLAALTMTVRSYLEEIEDPILKKKNMLGKKASIRGNFPISLRNTSLPILKNGEPGNTWTPLAFRFNFDFEDGVDCLWKVKKQIDKIKVSPKAIVQYENARIAGYVTPRRIYVELLKRLNTKVTTMLSNVPGPQSEVHIAGKTIEDLKFFLFSPLGIYLGLISYNGRVSMGINMDPNLDQDPNQLAKHWKTSFEKLCEDVSAYPDMIPESKAARKKLEKTVINTV